VVFVFAGGELAAEIVLEEKWREGLAEALEELRALGLEAEVLTGDPAGGKAGLPLPVRAGLSPDEKVRRVGQLVAEGRVVAFLGDGVNDAAAMSAAHASIAMNGGAELARASAGAVFAGTDLRFLPRAVRTARATRRSVHWNLRFASCYNIAGMALAAAGWLHPVAAALLMLGSSVVVSVSALRGARQGVGKRP
jgi:P-type E1-E2 ATPase